MRRVQVIKHFLTDGSAVFAVQITDAGSEVTLDCYSEHDAIKLREAIFKHSLTLEDR